MFRLRIALGKNVHQNVGWINPQTAGEYGLSEGDIIIDNDYEVMPVRLIFSDLIKLGELALPTSVMFKLGAYIGEERVFRVVDDIKDAKSVVLYVVGNIHDWTNFYAENKNIYITLDDEFSISPATSIRVLDIEGGSVGEVFRINKDTKIKLLFSGLMNLAIAIDASKSMEGPWGSKRKIDIAGELSRILLEYNLRKAHMISIFGYSDYVDILLNWFTLDPKYRGFLTRIFWRFATDMIISQVEKPDLEGALEFIVDSFAKKNLGQRYLNTIMTIQSVDSQISERRIRDIAEKFDQISNGVWRTIWIGMGDEEFPNLRRVAEIFGGVFLHAKTVRGLIKKARNLADFRHIDKYW